ncbi:uncharacterized protein F4822DRAFT_432518 [Hypoxylon trugodes]|uniref:uncharacterized protein n=1 Tax=Hypoxylon trugodes TaxID=326681 RepID=UPI002194B887|nr:uncharacterized protein F4822DRAFT_432518 [Hypoxylon trugodes]KAI1385663.1 hypothetical protein F4822DRAFT_432518 [Hypoxylon trugodes]
MFDSRYQSRRLLTVCAVLGLISRCWAAAQAIEFPATVEAHLIFPRNETYAPSRFFPIIFAIKGSQLAAPLDINFDYTIFEMSPNKSAPGSDGILDLRWINWANTSDPYYPWSYTVDLGDGDADDAQWYLLWTVSSGNCTNNESVADKTQFFNQGNGIEFSTKKGGKQPDFNAVAAEDDPSCSSILEGYFSWNVTGILDTPRPDKYDSHDKCAVLEPSRLGRQNSTTCGPRPDASAVSSLEAVMTSRACSALHPVISCPPDEPNGAAPFRGTQFVVGGMIWMIIAAFGGFMYILVL